MRRNYRRVAYLGDGAGDFCPTRLLGSHDTVIARERYPDGTICRLWSLLRGSAPPSSFAGNCSTVPTKEHGGEVT